MTRALRTRRLVGDQDSSGHVALPRPRFRDDDPRLAALRASGSPEEWVPHCEVIGSIPADPTVAPRIDLRVGWPDPPRTLAEIGRAVELGMGLAIQPQEGLDLRTISDVLQKARWLRIGGLRAVTGWESLSESVATVVSIGGASEPLPALPKVVRFSGIGRNVVGVLASPELEQFEVDLMGESWPQSTLVAGPLQRLHVSRARGFSELPALARPSALEAFVVHGAREFALTSLLAAPELVELSLSRVITLTGGDALAQLPKLNWLEVDGPRAWEGWESLSRTDIARFTLEHNHVIPDETAALWMMQHQGWRIDRRAAQQAT